MDQDKTLTHEKLMVCCKYFNIQYLRTGRQPVVQYMNDPALQQFLTGVGGELLKHLTVGHPILIVVGVEGDCSRNIELACTKEAKKKSTVLPLKHNPLKFWIP